MWPSFLPDGRHFLYYATNNDTAKSGIRIGSIDSDETLPLVSGTGPTFYVPEGYVLFTRQNTAFALPFDATKLRATGEAVAVIGEWALGGPPGSTLTVSQTGVLAYRNTSASDVHLIGPTSWRALVKQVTPGLTARLLSRPTERGPCWSALIRNEYLGPLVARSDRRISSRLTFDPADDTDPVWSPDGRQIAFTSARQGHLDIYRKVMELRRTSWFMPITTARCRSGGSRTARSCIRLARQGV